VATSSLAKVLAGTLAVAYEADEDQRGWVRLPSALHSGWYVVTVVHGGIPRQDILQVSDLSAYAVTTDTRSAVWVNDMRSNAAVAGAAVTLAGQRLGTTARNGLLVATTRPHAGSICGRVEHSSLRSTNNFSLGFFCDVCSVENGSLREIKLG
jgi:hypothetical protein